MKPKVLHVFKKNYTYKKHLYLGATKDIRGRTEYFQSRGIEYEELLADGKDKYNRDIADFLKADLQKFSAVILEMTFCPSAIRLIKNISPQTKVIVRSHNAELLHRFDWARTQPSSIEAIRSLKSTIKNTLCDYLSGIWADYVISISHWESKNYWPRMSRKSKIRCVPFFLPDRYMTEMPEPSVKKKQCVNFTASAPNPIIADATRNFIAAVNTLRDKQGDWTFCITGDQTKYNMYNIKTPDRILWTGFLENPYHKLAESQAMALLSDFGYGFKTKIMEAILSRAFILMTHGLYSRMPDEVRPYCIPVDVKSPESFRKALEQSCTHFPEGNPNADLRKQAFDALDEILLD